MSAEIKVRVPFIPLNIDNKDIAEHGELLVDLNSQELFIKSKDTEELVNIPTNDLIKDKTNELLSDILDNVDTEGNTLEKLYSLSKALEEDMTFHTNINDSPLANNIYKIITMFSNYNNDEDTILNLLSNKIDVEEGKGLTRNNISDEDIDKINSIEEDANYYVHSIIPECGIVDDVHSVNGYTGIVKIFKKDIPGLENVHPKANYYVHPEYKICDHIFKVNTVNDYTGDVVLNKSDIGLDKLYNYSIGSITDIDNSALDKYLTPEVVHRYIKNKLKIV